MTTKPSNRRYWSRHGSTRYINNFEQLLMVIGYVKELQEGIMTHFETRPALLPTKPPIGYFITIRTYGSWLPGDSRGYVNRKQFNVPNTPMHPQNPALRKWAKANMTQEKYIMDDLDREIVLKAIIEVCRYRNWYLHVVYLRADHIHIVVSSEERPEKVMNDFKAYASRALNRSSRANAWGTYSER